MWSYVRPPLSNSHQIWAVEVFHHSLPTYGIQNTEMHKKFFVTSSLRNSIKGPTLKVFLFCFVLFFPLIPFFQKKKLHAKKGVCHMTNMVCLHLAANKMEVSCFLHLIITTVSQLNIEYLDFWTVIILTLISCEGFFFFCKLYILINMTFTWKTTSLVGIILKSNS